MIPCYESPESGIVAAQTVEKLASMASLKPRDRRVLRMRYWEEMTLAEIGKCEHLTGARVGQIIFEVERHMRRAARYSFMRGTS
jgi:DNA-directed RNA polymerase specialized sigma subunit